MRLNGQIIVLEYAVQIWSEYHELIRQEQNEV